jgi:hypothetical protein
MGPTLGFETQSKETVFRSNLVFFLQLKQDSDKIMRKSHFNDEFLVLLGPIISRLFTCSNVEKNKT